MVDDGLSESEARSRIFMVDRFGLLTDDMTNLLDFQKNLLTARDAVSRWQVDSQNISLLDVVKNAHPTVMIGVSGQPGLFSEEIVKEMHRHCPRPIIMPLSNPTSRAEAQPQDLIAGPGVPRWWPPAVRSPRYSGRMRTMRLPSATTPISSRALGWACWPVTRAG